MTEIRVKTPVPEKAIKIPATEELQDEADMPELRLVKAVLLRALFDARPQCLTTDDKQVRRKAQAWIYEGDLSCSDYPFSFSWCCWQVFADPVSAGRQIRRQLSRREFKLWSPQMRRRNA